MLKLSQQEFEDNQKEVNIDLGLKILYNAQRLEFNRLLDLIKGIANVFDVDVLTYIIEEEKTSSMAIQKKQSSSAEPEPFEDDLTMKFYRSLPDLQRFA